MGGFLTICYCFKNIGCCCPFCFLEIFVGGQDLNGGTKSWWGMGRLLFSYCFLEIFVGRDKALMTWTKSWWEIPKSPPLGKTLQTNIFGHRPFIVESLKEAWDWQSLIDQQNFAIANCTSCWTFNVHSFTSLTSICWTIVHRLVHMSQMSTTWRHSSYQFWLIFTQISAPFFRSFL